MSDDSSKKWSDEEMKDAIERAQLATELRLLKDSVKEDRDKQEITSQAILSELSAIRGALIKIEKDFETHEDKMTICKGEIIKELKEYTHTNFMDNDAAKALEGRCTGRLDNFRNKFIGAGVLLTIILTYLQIVGG